TVQKVDSYRVTFDLMGTDPVARAGIYIPPVTQTVCDLTVKVDRVFSGTAFKAGDTYLLSEDMGMTSADIGERSAYYNISDFASALAFYQRKYPMVPYKAFAGQVVPGKVDSTSYFDPDRLPANKQKLEKPQEQSGSNPPDRPRNRPRNRS
ncbi:MAG: hypothetical protein FWF71_00550, partial [Actinomycetia bacterium]|nr:hypothetical protein [Actinomycetes bacterium]